MAFRPDFAFSAQILKLTAEISQGAIKLGESANRQPTRLRAKLTAEISKRAIKLGK